MKAKTNEIKEFRKQHKDFIKDKVQRENGIYLGLKEKMKD